MASPFSPASAPVELVVPIFQHCNSFADLRALFLTCRYIHAVWIANSPGIIWRVGLTVIPAFEQALMAARATASVHAAYWHGLLAPDIQLQNIAGGSRKPTVSELIAVLDLHHLVRCVEIRYCHVELHDDYALRTNYGRWPLDRVPPPPLNTPEEPGDVRVWKDRFHAAAYTSLLMGAVFFRAYNQPFHNPVTTSSPDDDTDRWQRNLFNLMRKASYTHSHSPYLRIEAEEREYLRRFPVFDLNDELGGQQGVFGPFIEWLIQSALLKHRSEPPPSSRDLSRDAVKAALIHHAATQDWPLKPPGSAWPDWPETGGLSQWFTGGSLAEGEAVLWTVMQSIHMFEFILTCITNSDGQRRLGRASVKSPGSFTGKTRTAKVVLFGVFQAEDILMPDNIMDSADQQLLAQTPFSSEMGAFFDQARAWLTASPPILDIPLVLDDLYAASGIPNCNHGEHMPPPPLQLFTFLLKHHFNLQFHKYVFKSWGDSQDYDLFKSRATIFSNGPEEIHDVPDREWFDYTNGMEFLAEYQPAMFTFRFHVDRDPDANPRTWRLRDD